MFKKIRAFIKENQMIEAGEYVLAGVSGGGDSMAMLSILMKLQKEIPFEIRVVHIHHGIRGSEADRDSRIVVDICEKMRLPYKVYYYNVPALAKEWKLGLEETGRIVRKKAFETEIKALQGKRVRIALAHNQDDLAETMLHHLARGSGIRGLSSMRPVSGEIIRPILCIRRREIDNYLIENQIPFVTDSTNLSDEYTRNKIRHSILPLLEEEINPRVCAHMAETAKVLAMAEDYFVRKAKLLLEEYRYQELSFLFTQDFFEKEQIIVRYVLLEAFRIISFKSKDFQAVHVQSVIELYEKTVGSKCSLPYGMEACREYEGVWLGKKEKVIKKDNFYEEFYVNPQGNTKCPLGEVNTKIFSFTGQKIPEKKYTKWLDYDKIKYSLCIRTRRKGDYLVIGKDGGHKKLSRYMIDEKIPKCDRDHIPLLVCGEEVLWVVGGRINENYKITPNTKCILEVEYQGGKRNE